MKYVKAEAEVVKFDMADVLSTKNSDNCKHSWGHLNCPNLSFFQ